MATLPGTIKLFLLYEFILCSSLKRKYNFFSAFFLCPLIMCCFSHYSWSRDSPWESCLLAADFDWKKIAEPVMELYTEATDGSSIEHKESALVWHHQESDPDFGSCQAKELLDHLENVLANEPVVVKRGQHIVEVKPQVSTSSYFQILV